jgi:hypothetical protein
MHDNRYEWDESKNQINIRKHGISFQEAETVFGDKNAIYEIDDEHSYNEERFAIIGRSKEVCHCYRENDTVIRIISARKANLKEKILYGEELE